MNECSSAAGSLYFPPAFWNNHLTVNKTAIQLDAPLANITSANVFSPLDGRRSSWNDGVFVTPCASFPNETFHESKRSKRRSLPGRPTYVVRSAVALPCDECYWSTLDVITAAGDLMHPLCIFPGLTLMGRKCVWCVCGVGDKRQIVSVEYLTPEAAVSGRLQPFAFVFFRYFNAVLFRCSMSV